MALDGPALALSDIMHGIAPSPTASTPQDDDMDESPQPDSATPEPLDSTQIDLMRKRVLELVVSGFSKTGASSHEKELLDMARHSLSHPSRRFALIGALPKLSKSFVNSELERQVATLDADNKALRQKLSEYHVRVQTVEAELAQLRPVLLMQPYALTHSFPPSHDYHAHATNHKPEVIKRPKRRKQGDGDQDATEEEPDNVAAASNTPRARPRGDYYRRRDADQFMDNPRHKRRTQKKGSSALADARAEHVLLAARKVGRERAAVLAGSAPGASRDKEETKHDHEQTDVAPKTPRKNQTLGVGNGSSTSVIYLKSPIPATADTAAAEHVSSDFSPVQTPSATRRSARHLPTQERPTRVNPLTPLDSLLTAASTISMIEEKDEEDGEDTHGESGTIAGLTPRASARRSSADSQAPAKRRRVGGSRPVTRSVAPSASGLESNGPSEGAARMRSALDVLADQAAVFSSQGHDSASAKDRIKGKGKAKASYASGVGAQPEEQVVESSIASEPARIKHYQRDRTLHHKDQAVDGGTNPTPPTLIHTQSTQTAVLSRNPESSSANEAQRLPSSSIKTASRFTAPIYAQLASTDLAHHSEPTPSHDKQNTIPADSPRTVGSMTNGAT
ncbi:hypothetical protein BC834DRAFT_968320 [Gloeopeniophorella convolvens]|nr:hypothetical protein BC834DRAFT_968320 [Gloeopeniophorella convolvens]